MTNPQILLIISHLATSNLEFEPRSRQLSPISESKIKRINVCPAWSLSHYSLPCFPGYRLSFSTPSYFDDRLPSFCPDATSDSDENAGRHRSGSSERNWLSKRKVNMVSRAPGPRPPSFPGSQGADFDAWFEEVSIAEGTQLQMHGAVLLPMRRQDSDDEADLAGNEDESWAE